VETLQSFHAAISLFERVVTAFAELPDNDYAVALKLEDYHCQGTSKRGACPLANFARRQLRPTDPELHIEVDELGLFLEADGVSLIWDLPDHLSEFVTQFDRKLYKFLLAA
jgi:hypothetical protein